MPGREQGICSVYSQPGITEHHTELLALLGFQEKPEIGIVMGVTCWSLIQIKIMAGVCGHEFVTSDLT